MSGEGGGVVSGGRGAGGGHLLHLWKGAVFSSFRMAVCFLFLNGYFIYSFKIYFMMENNSKVGKNTPYGQQRFSKKKLFQYVF